MCGGKRDTGVEFSCEFSGFSLSVPAELVPYTFIISSSYKKVYLFPQYRGHCLTYTRSIRNTQATCFPRHSVAGHILPATLCRRPHIVRDTVSQANCCTRHIVASHILPATQCRRPLVARDTVSQATCFPRHCVAGHILSGIQCRRPLVARDTV